MPPEDARYAALREMGAIEPRKEECRDARGLALVDSLRQDVTYALRALRKSPGFSTVAILSLALGIGANTTIFTFVNAVLLRPLPYPGSERLVVLREQPLGVQRHGQRASRELRRVARPRAVVRGAGAGADASAERDGRQRRRTNRDEPRSTSELFRVFGVAPALGRAFTEEETRPGRTRRRHPRPRLLAAVVWRRPRRHRTTVGDAGMARSRSSASRLQDFASA